MGAAIAKPRTIDGQTYHDPIRYVAAGDFDPEDVREVINAYKRYYAKKRRGDEGLPSTWMAYVAKSVGIYDTMAAEILRRYRNFYGK